MNKKLGLLLFLVLMSSGCSMVSWLNPFSDEGEKVSEAFEPNKYLWQAAHDKLAFMKIASEDKESGTIITDWDKVDANPNEEFKIEAKVLSTELRSDCLQVVVYRRKQVGGSWVDMETNIRLNQEIETAILNQARVLYRKSLEINKD